MKNSSTQTHRLIFTSNNLNYYYIVLCSIYYFNICNIYYYIIIIITPNLTICYNSIVYFTLTTAHIQIVKFLVLKSITNIQCPQKPNCCNYLTTHKTTTCEYSTSLDFLSCQSRQEIPYNESIKFCKDACKYRSIESNHFTVVVKPLRPCQPNLAYTLFIVLVTAI